MGLDDNLAYADALSLLERGADPNRGGADGMTFEKMLLGHRTHFGQTLKGVPVEFATLWDWPRRMGSSISRGEPKSAPPTDAAFFVGRSLHPRQAVKGGRANPFSSR
jgi:hypothetical protein